MATFIEEVATRLYEKYGDDVATLTLVLPSKRARLFFAEALSKAANRAVWEPKYISMDELMCQLSNLRKADKLRLVAELYTIYSEYHTEDIDKFYSWGELLISDFDMLDKYNVDAAQLFSNIRDLKELEQSINWLDDEKIALINRFWGTLLKDTESQDISKTKEHFLRVWRSLNSVYEGFHKRLHELGIGYTGMIYRQAIERLKQGEAELPHSEKYVVVGFNALSECEKELLTYMKNNCHVEFFWDYDNYYVENKAQEAGMFIRQNLELSQSEGVSHSNFQNIASVNVLSTSSNVAQCQCVVDILEDIASKSDGTIGKDTAVVLTDENLLMPLLYALPEKFKVERSVKDGVEVVKPILNVTMGYPLRNTLAYSFVERLLELQKHASHNSSGEVTFYHADVNGLLFHPYVAESSTDEFAELRKYIVEHHLFNVPISKLSGTPLLQTIFRKTEGWQQLSEYLLEVVDAVSTTSKACEEGASRSEYLSVVYDALVKLQNIIKACGIESIKSVAEHPEKFISIYRSLVRRHLQAERIPFTGEPLKGLQIMGILETRNLDFKNVILLSMTDNNFPGSRSTDKSFIPYGLRCGFNIPVAEHHEGVHAYYFYRLIQRAENLYMLYSSSTDDKSTGEPSRYIRQLEYETDFKINHTNVGVEVALSDQRAIEVEKDDKVFEKLLRFTDAYAGKGKRTISPTAISTYVTCPLKFYLNVVELMRPEGELENEVDNMTFGNIFHRAADLLYTEIIGDANPKASLERLRKEGKVEKCVDQAIAEVYFNNKEGKLQQLGGEMLITRDIVREYLGKNLLNYDMENNDFVVKDTEYTLELGLPIDVGENRYVVNFSGRADRVDSLNNGLLRVIDYKTGKPNVRYNSIEDLFHGTPISDHREYKIINTLLYAMILHKMENRDVRPELFFVGRMVDPKSAETLFVEGSGKGNKKTLEAYSECAEAFEQEIQNTLREIFDRNVPFRQCEDSSPCEYCDYQKVCNRK